MSSSSTFPTSSTPTQSFHQILNDLNRDVVRSNPSDPLQFCANWFNARLESERKRELEARRRSGGGGSTSSSIGIGGASATNIRLEEKPLKGVLKKRSTPSIVQGYSFGTAGQEQGGGGRQPVGQSERSSPTSLHFPSSITATDSGLSPRSEFPPPGGPFGPPSSSSPSSSSSATPTYHNANNLSPTRSLAAARALVAARVSSGLTRPPISGSGPSSGIEDEDLMGSEDEDRDQEQFEEEDEEGHGGPTTAMGIPLNYNLGRRTSVSAESLPSPSDLSNAPILPKTVIPKTASQRARIEASIKDNILFKNLDEAQHEDVMNAMKETTVERGTEIIKQGGIGDYFFVVEKGQFECFVKSDQGVGGGGEAINGGRGKKVCDYGPGGSFGELALMYNAPRAATIVCSTPGSSDVVDEGSSASGSGSLTPVSPGATLWALDRMTFRSILMEHTFRKRKMFENFLSSVPLLKSLRPEEKAKIADSLEEKSYDEGEVVIREGERGREFYLVIDGVAEVSKRRRGKDGMSVDGENDEDVVGRLTKGDYFGELALLNSNPRAATVRVATASGRLRVAYLGAAAFTRLLGPMKQLLEREARDRYGSVDGFGGGGNGNGGSHGGSGGGGGGGGRGDMRLGGADAGSGFTSSDSASSDTTAVNNPQIGAGYTFGRSSADRTPTPSTLRQGTASPRGLPAGYAFGRRGSGDNGFHPTERSGMIVESR